MSLIKTYNDKSDENKARRVYQLVRGFDSWHVYNQA